MRSTSNSRSVVVGIFTLLGIAIFAITILTLGSQRKTFSESLVVTSYYQNVNGLQKGNNVWFSGVKVGTIKSVDIIENGRVEVKMNIDRTAREFIHKDAIARLSSDGLIGNKIIEIYGGSSSAPVIKTGDVIETKGAFDTDDMMNTLSKNNDNLVEVTHNMGLITAGMAEGKGTIGKLLTDETLINQVNAITENLNRTSRQIEQLTKVAAAYFQKFSEPGNLANSLVTDTVIFSNLKQITEQLRLVTDSSQKAISSLNSVGNTLKEGLQNEKTPLGMMLNDEEASRNLKSTLSNLESASQKLDEDLEAVQHNFLFRRFFKKKAKQEAQQRVVLDTLLKK